MASASETHSGHRDTRMPQFNHDAAGDVAGAVATQMLANLWAGADPDRQAELYAILTPYLYDAIFAYCEAMSGAWGFVPEPSRN